MKKDILFVICIILVIIGYLLYDSFYNVDNSDIYVDSNKTYEETIFDNSFVHEINVLISNEYYEDLLKNPTRKTNYRADVIIDGVKVKSVAFHTKGNSSLNKVAMGPPTERYSFKIDFGKYNKTQKYDGLDKIHLNNIYADATYIKDYMCYSMFRKMNVNAPLTSFAFLKINGRDIGLYMLAEDVGDSFLERNNLDGNLYKPEQNGRNNGASLEYRGDNVEDYTDIFDNKITNPKGKDYLVLINSLKDIGNNTNIEEVTDIDELTRYFAVHNFVLSYDSYTGRSIHNYFLYEKDGKISLFPWDYNMSYGSFEMKNDPTYIVNYGIDSPLYDAHEKNRPLWAIVKNNHEYLSKYHSYMNLLINTYFLSNDFDNEVDRTYELIKPYFDRESTPFYKPEEVEEAINTFKEFNKLRVESVQKQLNGELEPDAELQDDISKVNASHIDMTKMGMMTSIMASQMEGPGGMQPQQGPGGGRRPPRGQ